MCKDGSHRTVRGGGLLLIGFLEETERFDQPSLHLSFEKCPAPTSEEISSRFNGEMRKEFLLVVFNLVWGESGSLNPDRMSSSGGGQQVQQPGEQGGTIQPAIRELK